MLVAQMPPKAKVPHEVWLERVSEYVKHDLDNFYIVQITYRKASYCMIGRTSAVKIQNRGHSITDSNGKKLSSTCRLWLERVVPVFTDRNVYAVYTADTLETMAKFLFNSRLGPHATSIYEQGRPSTETRKCSCEDALSLTNEAVQLMSRCRETGYVYQMTKVGNQIVIKLPGDTTAESQLVEPAQAVVSADADAASVALVFRHAAVSESAPAVVEAESARKEKLIFVCQYSHTFI